MQEEEHLNVRKMCSSWMHPVDIPKSFCEQCVVLLARALTATKDPVVIEPIYTAICEQARRQYRNSLHSLDGAFGRMRKVVLMALKNDKQHPVWCLTLKMLNVTGQQRRQLRQESDDHVETANSHMFSFEEDRIRALLGELVESDDEFDGILLLMLESGLRMIEVLCTAAIEKATVNTRADCEWVAITGLAKTKHPDRKVVKPLLSLTYDVFEMRFNELRASIAEKAVDVTDRKAVTNMYNHGVNARLHKHLGPYTSHIARKIYGAISFEWYGRLRGQSYNSWLQSVMGHSSIVTSLSYSNVCVVKSTEQLHPESADVAFFTKAGSHPIALDDLLAYVADTIARPRWVCILQRNFASGQDYTMSADGGIHMSVWCSLDLMAQTGRPRAINVMQRVRKALLYGMHARMNE